MEVPGQKRGVSIGVIIGTFCILAGAITIGGLRLLRAAPGEQTAPTPVRPAAALKELRGQRAGGNAAAPSGSTDLQNLSSGDISAQMDLLNQQVAGLRGLSQSFLVPRKLVSPEAFREHITAYLDHEYPPEEQKAEELLTVSLGLLPPGEDLRKLYVDFFSFTSGVDFVAGVMNQGGWQAVNEVISRPPVTSEQILHPAHFPNDAPRKVQLPDLSAILGPDWARVNEDSLGEWYTYLTFAYGADPSARVPIELARRAAAGWEGDHFAVFSGPGDASALVLVDLWDTSHDSREFMDAMRVYGGVRWGKPSKDLPAEISWQAGVQAVKVASNNTYTYWVITPSPATTRALANRLQTP